MPDHFLERDRDFEELEAGDGHSVKPREEKKRQLRTILVGIHRAVDTRRSILPRFRRRRPQFDAWTEWYEPRHLIAGNRAAWFDLSCDNQMGSRRGMRRNNGRRRSSAAGPKCFVQEFRFMAAVNADRNLLFALLALQNGLIDQDQLVAAFRAWSRDKGRAIDEYLVERGDLDADQRHAVELMVGLHEKKHGGSAETSLAAISAGRSTRESLAALGDSDIAGSLCLMVSEAKASQSDPGTDRTTTFDVGAATGNAQRFRVVRPHARGGLGAVYVAIDTELHREVALKQILDQHADDPASRARFLIEAEITGGLEHPGIVPVYGLGAYADGRPYYAMRFVRGDSLKEAIGRFHQRANIKSPFSLVGEAQGDGPAEAAAGSRDLELRKLLRRFIDVCNAIGYAHSRGVLHRDIKPANIIVGNHGETLVVDWGLAKALGRADATNETGERTLVPRSGSGSAETLPGSALGTPAYMCPEQATGDLESLGPRSDVYALGATLYCLLTGQPPCDGDDVGEVLRKVQRGEFARPRQRDPAIDPALEAVCTKAMTLDPADRYATSRALADDIERWMADEPVSAWREPFAPGPEMGTSESNPRHLPRGLGAGRPRWHRHRPRRADAGQRQPEKRQPRPEIRPRPRRPGQ